MDFDLETSSGKRVIHSNLNTQLIGHQGEGDEVTISRILWDLADENSDALETGLKDEIAIGHVELYTNVLKAIAGKTENNLEKLQELWKHLYQNDAKLNLPGLNTEARRTKLGAIFEGYNVSPSPIRTVDSFDIDSSPTSFKWNVGNFYDAGSGNVGGNDTFQIFIYNQDFSKLIAQSDVLEKENSEGSKWSFDKTAAQGSWTPTLEQWSAIISNPGTYQMIVAGADTREGLLGEKFTPPDITGLLNGQPYYRSGAYTFEILRKVDGDKDNVSDSIEILAGDRNKDGTPDNQQSNVASFRPSNSNSNNPNDFITLATTQNINLVDVSTTDALPPNAPAETDLPLGLINFNLENVANGQSTQVDLLLPQGVTTNTYWKYDEAQGWFDFLFDGSTGAEFIDNNNDGINEKIILHFVDGGRGDSDGIANGIITDPGAPGFSQRPVSNTPPQLTQEIADQTVNADTVFEFTLPENTFTDADPGDTLSYSATLANGNPLPSWLSFDVLTGMLNGTPSGTDIGNLDVKVTATDTQNAQVSDIFTINVTQQNARYALTTVDTWIGAQAQAQALGGNLVTINNAQEQKLLIETFGGSESVWIGLTDEAKEGDFRWINGEDAAFRNWVENEPNNINNEDYIAMNEHVAGGWNDLNETERLRGIIEFNPAVSDVTIPEPSVI